MKRTHDLFYLNEDPLKVKQSFVEVLAAMNDEEWASAADVGCAAGAFPGYVNENSLNKQVTGIEYVPELIDAAALNFPKVNFLHGNVLDQNSVNIKFDVITMLGVLCIFDDYSKVIGNVLSWLKPGGRLILHNMFSDFDIDVFVKYKPSGEFSKDEVLESGWNILSMSSLKIVAKLNGARVIDAYDLSLGIDLPKQSDVMRSWTELNNSGDRDIFNALHIRQPQKIVTLKRV